MTQVWNMPECVSRSELDIRFPIRRWLNDNERKKIMIITFHCSSGGFYTHVSPQCSGETSGGKTPGCTERGQTGSIRLLLVVDSKLIYWSDRNGEFSLVGFVRNVQNPLLLEYSDRANRVRRKRTRLILHQHNKTYAAVMMKLIAW